MLRTYYVGLLAAVALLGQARRPDPALPTIPLEELLKGGNEAKIRWTLRVFPAYLSDYQRMATTVRAAVDSEEYRRRNKRGQLAVLMEIRDRDNRTHRSSLWLLPENGQNPTDLKVRTFIQHACILPGDYEITVAVYDTESKEYSLKRMNVRFPDLPHDPLPSAWRDLPNVEFSSCGPVNSARLSLPLKTEKPVRVEVVMNQTLNRNKSGSSVLPRMNPLITRLEVLSEIDVRNGSLHITLLDLERRKVTFMGKVNGNPNPIRRRLRPALRENDPYKIDVHALENSKENAQFFVSEIAKRLTPTNPDEAEHVMIILSAPLKFRKGEDLQPIQAPAAFGGHVYYIRCNSPVYGSLVQPPGIPSPDLGAPPELPSGPPVTLRPYSNNSDSLERTLQPLHPRLFDVATAAEFRKALAAILSEISQQQ